MLYFLRQNKEREHEQRVNVKIETGLRSIAIRVVHMEKMRAFYSEAFKGTFTEVDLGGGLNCQFGQFKGVLIKLIPIREKTDFETFPIHQMGFYVEDVEQVIEIALKYGGQQEGEVFRQNGEIHGALRDPDGNSIELVSPHDQIEHGS